MVKSNTLYKPNDEVIITSKIEKQIKNDKLFENIKKIFSEDKKIKKNNIYFTTSNGKIKFNIDDTIFLPNKVSILQIGKFDELYLAQLEDYIYSNKEDIDTSKLFPIIYLFSHINKNNYPIKITSSYFPKLLPKICNILNKFFNKNYSVIYSIYTMFNSIRDTELEKNQNN